MRWHFLSYGDEAKAHVVPESRREAIVADLAARGCVVAAEKETAEAGIDHGGMAFAGRPWVDVDLDGLKFSVPCDCIRDFLVELLRLQPRMASGLLYFKLHCRWNCIVLTPEQREQLLALWTAALPDAEERDRAWWSGVERKMGERTTRRVS